MNIHIVFGDSAAGSLRIALRSALAQREWDLISFSDRFSVGPIWHLHEESGMEHRVEWLSQRISEEARQRGEHEDYKKAFYQSVQRVINIPDEAEVSIWNFENAHEQTGTRFVLKLLRKRSKPVQLMNIPSTFHKERTTQTFLHLGEFSCERLAELLESITPEPVRDDRRDQLLAEWDELSQSTSLLRVWQNGQLVSVPEDTFDDVFIRVASKKFRGTFIKAARLIGEVMGSTIPHYVGDEFLEYRLRCLIEKGVFQAEGPLYAMRYYSVRLNK
ncbi:DUF1835 domain-containing protein [Brevibacillus sp. SYSU BS000544]|uniref:DUF1835 domain-containing protein n=1 Tax=Brevibacillus sp. SYSU BS000544 TaxID=3416443 RepID=UPI003CE505C5